MKASKPVRAWGGFMDGKLDEHYAYGGPLAVFTRRSEAQKYYCDVRKVEVREVARKAKRRKAK